MRAIDPSPRRLPGPLRALEHRNFRLYFFGQAVSILGSWIQQVAMAWLVYRLTGSAALLGVTAFAALIPQLLVGPLAGAWIDKHDKRKWLMRVQGLLAAQALVLAGLTWMGWVGPGLLVSMAVLLGVLNSFDTPLRQSLISVFVARREDLPNALALNAMLFNTGRFVGPPVAGLLLGLTSEAACFALNAVSFVALFVAVASVKVPAMPRAQGSVGDVFKEGLAYAWHTWPVRMLIIVLMALNLTASAYAVLLPVFAAEVFAGDARTLGLLWGAAGCGAFRLDGLPGHPAFGAGADRGHQPGDRRQCRGAAGLWLDPPAAGGHGGHGDPGFRHFGVQRGHQHAAPEHGAGSAARADRVLLHLGPFRLRCPRRLAGRFHRQRHRARADDAPGGGGAAGFCGLPGEPAGTAGGTRGSA
jgi:MFS family permease